MFASLHLPAHDQTTTNRSRAVFCSINWHNGGFGAHTDTQQQTGDEKLRPGLRKARANDGDEAEDCSEEDGTTTAEVIVQGVREPAAAR